ncbi:uncharacterized protein LOC144100282 [Amblyomma americanum]
MNVICVHMSFVVIISILMRALGKETNTEDTSDCVTCASTVSSSKTFEVGNWCYCVGGILFNVSSDECIIHGYDTRRCYLPRPQTPAPEPVGCTPCECGPGQVSCPYAMDCTCINGVVYNNADTTFCSKDVQDCSRGVQPVKCNSCVCLNNVTWCRYYRDCQCFFGHVHHKSNLNTCARGIVAC